MEEKKRYMVIREHVMKERIRRLIFAALLVFFSALGIIAAAHLISAQWSYVEAQREYATLQQYAPDAKATPSGQGKASEQTTEAQLTLDLSDINPDYIGWIRIEGTKIDYPIVQAKDNEKYLHTTFSSERNASGAIFMDYRCRKGFESLPAIIYGHNMKDGSMFASLHHYRDRAYLDEHPEIIILTADGNKQVYRVFAAFEADITDPVYHLPNHKQEAVKNYMVARGAPESAERFIVLSTCTRSRNEAKRLLVLAAQ